MHLEHLYPLLYQIEATKAMNDNRKQYIKIQIIKTESQKGDPEASDS